MVNGGYCELGWIYFGVFCVSCVPYREKVAGETIASIRINIIVVSGWQCKLGYGYLGGRCLTCVPFREKVASDTNASMIDGAYPVLLTRHKQVAADRI